MQGAIFQHETDTQFQKQVSRVLPGHGTGLGRQVGNDEPGQDESSLLLLVISVLANVIGGAILLSTMLVLPHIVVRIFS